MKKLSPEKVARMTPEVRAKYKARLRRVERNRRIIIIFAAIAVIASAATALSVTVLFNITEIIVPKPGKYYKSDEIISASGLDIGENMIRTDFDAACSRIERNLPYVLEATATKSFSGRITISIKDNSAAIIHKLKNGSFALADSNGKVLEIIEEEPKDNKFLVLKTQNEINALPGDVIDFADSNESKLYSDIQNELKKVGLKDITGINISEQDDIYLEYQHRFLLQLGSAVQLNEKLKAAKETIALEDKSNPNSIGEINLTIVKKAYVKPLESLTPKTETTENTNAKQQSD